MRSGHGKEAEGNNLSAFLMEYNLVRTLPLGTYMIPHEKINENVDIRRFARATSTPFWKANIGVLRELFYNSLLANDAEYHPLRIQFDILRVILDADSARKTYRRYKQLLGRAIQGLAKSHVPVERIKIAQERFESMGEAEAAAVFFMERLRAIGDAIAWRFLEYDRSVLRLLAEHPVVSTPQLGVGLATEVGELLRLSEEYNRPVLLNAITNFLRVADITAYDPATHQFELVEVKSGKSVNARTQRQGDYISLVQEGLDTGVHSLSGKKIQKILANRPLLTYARSVEGAMREAEQRLASSRLFGEYMGIGVFALTKIIETVPENEWPELWAQVTDRVAKVWRKDSDVVLSRMDNLFAVTHFIPNLAPYAIFPMDPKYRFGLLTGDFLVFSYLNISGLARWLEKRGWKVEVVAPVDKLPDFSEFPHVGAIKVWNGPFGVEVGVDSLMMAAGEFHMPESIETSIEAIFGAAFADGGFRNESADHLWQVTYPNTGKYAWD